MDFTPKQVRNGADIGGGDNASVAMPGPMPDTAAVMSQSTSAGNNYSELGHQQMLEPSGSTVSFEWDAGLAINDVEGGGSG
jgi:hypothetical protein